MSTANAVISALEQRGFRKHGNEWRGNSPLRPGSDSKSFAVTIDDDEHGAWHDHVSNDSGSLYQLAEQLGIETPKPRKEVQSTKRAYADLEDYAKAHGIEPDILLEAGWREVTHQSRPALSFPTKNGTRYRFLDNKKPTYISEQGYKACWYGLDKAVERAKTQGAALILCNGEISTVTAQTYGLPACAVTSGEKAIPPELLGELRSKWRGKITLVYDCDDTGRRVAQDVAAQLADYSLAVVDLGLVGGGDLADFLTLYASDAYSAFYKLVPEHTKPGLETIAKSAIADLAASAGQLSRAIRDERMRRDGADMEALTAQVQADLDRVRMSAAKPKVRGISDVVKEAQERLMQRVSNPGGIPGLRLGIRKLDKAIGGLQEATVNVIYGATSMGKSTFVTSVLPPLMTQAVEQDGCVLVIPTESLSWRYTYKIAAAMCHISSDLIGRGELGPVQVKLVLDTLDRLSQLGCELFEGARPTPSAVRAAVLAGQKRYKAIVIDSVSNMAVAGDYASVAEVNNVLQELALSTGIPFLITSQVGRDVSERGEGLKWPRLTDAYGGGVIENNADVVIGMYRHQYYVDQKLEEPNALLPADVATAIMLKNRWSGNVGKKLNLHYEAGVGMFEREVEAT